METLNFRGPPCPRSARDARTTQASSNRGSTKRSFPKPEYPASLSASQRVTCLVVCNAERNGHKFARSKQQRRSASPHGELTRTHASHQILAARVQAPRGEPRTRTRHPDSPPLPYHWCSSHHASLPRHAVPRHQRRRSHCCWCPARAVHVRAEQPEQPSCSSATALATIITAPERGRRRVRMGRLLLLRLLRTKA